MKRLLVFLGAMLSFLSFAACNSQKEMNTDAGDGHYEAERNVGKLPYFNKIVIDGVVDVVYRQGDGKSIKVKGDAKAVELVSLKVDAQTRTLHVALTGNDWNIIRSKKKLSMNRSVDAVVYVTSPDLVGVEMHGAGDFKARGLLDTDTLRVLLHGAGDMDFDHVVCDEAYLTLRGAGDIDFDKLTARYSKLLLNGVGDIEVDFADAGHVDCQLMGVGDIDLKGNVKSLRRKVAGTGDIDTKHLKVKE